ncbi:MAG: phosphopantetheinyl transferase [Parvicellaceae bacterium]|jgi:phosphopantetheinyl transferase
MNYVQIIETKVGCIWLMNATENNIPKERFKTKVEYERYVIDLIVKDVIGNYSVSHLDNGAPVLNSKEKSHISISHSKDYFSVYYSEVGAVGIDVEVGQRSLIKGRHYFLNERELLKDWTNDELYKIWGIKEVFFKLKQGNMEDLAEAITIDNIVQNKVTTSRDEEAGGFGIYSFEAGVLIYSSAALKLNHEIN